MAGMGHAWVCEATDPRFGYHLPFGVRAGGCGGGCRGVWSGGRELSLLGVWQGRVSGREKKSHQGKQAALIFSFSSLPTSSQGDLGRE